MSAVGAVLLASDLSHGLARWAYLVDHSVLSLPLSKLCPDYDDFFLRYPDRLVTPGTEVIAQFEASNDKWFSEHDPSSGHHLDSSGANPPSQWVLRTSEL